MKKIIMLALGIVICMSMMSCGGSYSSSSSRSSEKGSWGSDGYYNPTDAELKEAVKEANEWLEENW